MGGEVESTVHCDLVCLGTEVLIDGKAILRDNEVVLREVDWREDYHDLKVPGMWTPSLRLRSTTVGAHTDGEGHLKRFWHTSSGRVCAVHVGSDSSAVLANSIYQSFQKNGRRHTIAAVARQHPNLRMQDLLRVTYLLNLYGLVRPESPDLNEEMMK